MCALSLDGLAGWGSQHRRLSPIVQAAESNEGCRRQDRGLGVAIKSKSTHVHCM